MDLRWGVIDVVLSWENLQAKRRRSVCPIMSPMSSLPSCDGTPILMRRLPLSKHPQRSRLGRKSPAANRFHPGRTCFLASAPQRGVGRWLYWGESTDTRRQRCSTNQLNSFGPAAPNNVSSLITMKQATGNVELSLEVILPLV